MVWSLPDRSFQLYVSFWPVQSSIKLLNTFTSCFTFYQIPPHILGDFAVTALENPSILVDLLLLEVVLVLSVRRRVDFQ